MSSKAFSKTITSAHKTLQGVHKTPALAPMLFPQGNAVHGHAPVYGFAHVVNGEQADLGGHINQQLSCTSSALYLNFLMV